MSDPLTKPTEPGLRRTLHEIIFEAETPAGRAFDIVLLWAILGSILAVLLESVQDINQHWGYQLRIAEWIFTILFTVEYLLRIFCCVRPSRYIFSFFGLIDFFSIMPTYLGLIFSGTQYLLVVRSLRLLRVFRVLKMTRYIGEAEVLLSAMQASRHKITVFLFTVCSVVAIVGALMHIIEGPDHGFTSIPVGMYWAVVTMTTVGYGDIAPQTILGQTLAAILMICGYGIIAVPTGIVSVELSKASDGYESRRKCSSCETGEDDPKAKYCRRCGTPLDDTNELLNRTE